MIHTEAAPGHDIRMISATPGVAHDAYAPLIAVTAIDFLTTHHIDFITDHLHIEALWLTTPEITVDHAHDHPTNLQGENCTGQIHIPADHEANYTSRRT